MNSWEKHVNYCILKYPILYALPTYELCELNVAHQVFAVLGNGYDWVDKDDGCKILSCNESPVNHSFTINDFIGKEWWEYYINENDYLIRDNKIITLIEPTDGKFIDVCNIKSNDVHNSAKSPYPNFTRRFNNTWEVTPEKIEHSWRNAMLKHYNHWLNHYESGDYKQYTCKSFKLDTTDVKKEISDIIERLTI